MEKVQRLDQTPPAQTRKKKHLKIDQVRKRTNSRMSERDQQQNPSPLKSTSEKNIVKKQERPRQKAKEVPL